MSQRTPIEKVARLSLLNEAKRSNLLRGGSHWPNRVAWATCVQGVAA
jgi:hypothetical protein